MFEGDAAVPGVVLTWWWCCWAASAWRDSAGAASAGRAGCCCCWRAAIRPHQLPASAAQPRGHVTSWWCHPAGTFLHFSSWLFDFSSSTVCGASEACWFCPFRRKMKSKISVIVVLVLKEMNSCLWEECFSLEWSCWSLWWTTCRRKARWKTENPNHLFHILGQFEVGLVGVSGSVWRQNCVHWVKQQQNHPLVGASPLTLPGDTTRIRLLTVRFSPQRFVIFLLFFSKNVLLNATKMSNKETRLLATVGFAAFLQQKETKERSQSLSGFFFFMANQRKQILCFYSGNQTGIILSPISKGFYSDYGWKQALCEAAASAPLSLDSDLNNPHNPFNGSHVRNFI